MEAYLSQPCPDRPQVGARAIMRECECLADLTELSVDSLARLLGGERPAKALHEFLHAQCPVP